MTTCYPALRGRFGRTEYFTTVMPVSELVSRVKLPTEMPDWKSQSIEERYQRKLDVRRIIRDLAPYFAQDDKRFSGSLVLAVVNDGTMRFEHLSELIAGSANLPNLYTSASSDMGFLTLGGGEVLVPLDGQHRAMAFKMAIEGHPGDRSSPPILPNMGLGSDTVAVILVRFDKKVSRYIFNKINRYAKPTTKADKLITDDDDAVAVITRSLITDGVIPARLVNDNTNTLSPGAHEFTTLATLYEANKTLISALPVATATKPAMMDGRERDDRLRELKNEWRSLLSGIGLWRQATADPGEGGDAARTRMRQRSVLGRPIGQTALINGYALACRKDRTRADRAGLVSRLDRLDWDMKAAHWRDLLVRPNGKIMAGRPASNNAGIVIAHMIGAALTQSERDGALRFVYGRADGGRLPPRVA